MRMFDEVAMFIDQPMPPDTAGSPKAELTVNGAGEAGLGWKYACDVEVRLHYANSQRKYSQSPFVRNQCSDWLRSRGCTGSERDLHGGKGSAEKALEGNAGNARSDAV